MVDLRSNHDTQRGADLDGQSCVDFHWTLSFFEIFEFCKMLRPIDRLLSHRIHSLLCLHMVLYNQTCFHNKC